MRNICDSVIKLERELDRRRYDSRSRPKGFSIMIRNESWGMDAKDWVIVAVAV